MSRYASVLALAASFPVLLRRCQLWPARSCPLLATPCMPGPAIGALSSHAVHGRTSPCVPCLATPCVSVPARPGPAFCAVPAGESSFVPSLATPVRARSKSPVPCVAMPRAFVPARACHVWLRRACACYSCYGLLCRTYVAMPGIVRHVLLCRACHAGSSRATCCCAAHAGGSSPVMSCYAAHARASLFMTGVAMPRMSCQSTHAVPLACSTYSRAMPFLSFMLAPACPCHASLCRACSCQPLLAAARHADHAGARHCAACRACRTWSCQLDHAASCYVMRASASSLCHALLCRASSRQIVCVLSFFAVRARASSFTPCLAMRGSGQLVPPCLSMPCVPVPVRSCHALLCCACSG